MPLPTAAGRPLGLALGVLADAVLADPRRAHPVAGFGHLAGRWERAVYADGVTRGAVFTTMAVAAPVAAGTGLELLTRSRPVLRTLLTALGTWTVLGGAGLLREGTAMAGYLEAGDLDAAKRVELNLPETGVCAGPGNTTDANACCDGPAPAEVDACCVDDATAKAAGEAGCGCSVEA